MSAHDPLCPEASEQWAACLCERIARVRADEQRNFFADAWEENIRADERERIAQAVQALPSDGSGWVMRRDVWAAIERVARGETQP